MRYTSFFTINFRYIFFLLKLFYCYQNVLNKSTKNAFLYVVKKFSYEKNIKNARFNNLMVTFLIKSYIHINKYIIIIYFYSNHLFSFISVHGLFPIMNVCFKAILLSNSDLII